MSEEEKKRRVYVTACPDCNSACFDDEESSEVIENFSFEIPGADKMKIKLHVAEDRIRLLAPRKNSDIEYISEYLFMCPVNPEVEVKAKYEDGVLNVEIPLKCENPYDNAKEIMIK